MIDDTSGSDDSASAVDDSADSADGGSRPEGRPEAVPIVEHPGADRLACLGTRVVLAGCGLAALGVFTRWSSGDGVTLNGIQGPHNGWVILLALGLAVSVVRSLRRGGRTAALAILLVSIVVIVVLAGTRGVPGADHAWGYWITLAGGVLLVAAAALAFAGRSLRSIELDEPPRPRRRLPTLGEAGLVAAVLFVLLLGKVLMIGEEPSWPPPPHAVTAPDAQSATEAFVASVGGPRDVAVEYAWSTAATIDPWAEGTEFYPRIFEDVRNATSSVHILMFGWKPGEVGGELTSVLVEKAAEGVEVRAVVDGVGSRPTSSSREMYDRLVDAGVDVVVNDPLPFDRDRRLGRRVFDWDQDEIGRADHRKLYVIDGEIAWVGGAGIEDHFANGEFYDVMVRVTGDIVLQTQSIFLNSFASHGEALPEDLGPYFPTQPNPGGTAAAVVQVVPGGFVSATQAARQLIDEATERLDIMNPYVTDRDMIERIINAAQRGVAVRVVTSEESNNVLAARAMQYRYGDLIDAGVEVWEYPGAVVHAKLIVADDAVQFGTLNMDAWALYRNFEIAIVAESPAAAERLERRVFEPAIDRSSRATAPSAGGQFVNWVIEKFAYFL